MPSLLAIGAGRRLQVCVLDALYRILEYLGRRDYSDHHLDAQKSRIVVRNPAVFNGGNRLMPFGLCSNVCDRESRTGLLSQGCNQFNFPNEQIAAGLEIQLNLEHGLSGLFSLKRGFPFGNITSAFLIG